MVPLVYPTYSGKRVSFTFRQSVLKVTFLDILATLGVSKEYMNDQKIHKFCRQCAPTTPDGLLAEMLYFVPSSNRPSLIKDWTQTADLLVKLQAIMLGLENSLAKN